MKSVRKRIPLLFLLAFITIEPATSDETVNDDPGLLATLEELRISLDKQIDSLVKKISLNIHSDEEAELNHLVRHYTAQKNNIDREISHIRSINAKQQPRHLETPIKPQEKTYPSIFTLFRRNKNDTDDMTLPANVPYAPPFPPYYFPPPGSQYPNPNFPPPPFPPPIQAFPSDLNQPNTPPTIFINREQQIAPNFQRPVQPNIIHLPPNFPPAHSNVQGPQLQPHPNDPQVQVQQTYRPMPQQNPQAFTGGNQNPQQQAPPQGQMPALLVYYPDNPAPNDTVVSERPSIANRVNQAFDRLISNLTNRQPSRKPQERENVNQPAKKKMKENGSGQSGMKDQNVKSRLRWVAV